MSSLEEAIVFLVRHVARKWKTLKVPELCRWDLRAELQGDELRIVIVIPGVRNSEDG